MSPGAGPALGGTTSAEPLDSATGATGSQDALQMKLSDFSSRVNLTLKGVDTSK